jgi:hypothetical protein
MARYAAITSDNIVRGVYYWAASFDWIPPSYQPTDNNGNPIGNPQPTTAVPDTDPPTAQIDFVYDPVANTFTDLNTTLQPAASSPGLFSRILSALNPFN